MDKKNWWVILILVLVIAVIAFIGFVMPKQNEAPVVTVTDPGGVITTLAPEPAETAAPAAQTSAADPTAAPGSAADDEDPDDEKPAFVQLESAPRAWLLITVDEKVYAPYPLTKVGDYTVNQKKKNAKNVIHVTEDSIQMTSSTCDNQVCVHEGVVTLENKESRILGGYIVCLPNGVTLQLLDENEYKAMMTGQAP